jgi:quinol monooxygenase YgiN
MVQFLARLNAPPGDVDELLSALRTLMRPALQARGCSFAHVYHSPNEPCRVEYVEEWDDAAELRDQLGSERFRRLLGLLEMAADRPTVEFRVISDTHGLEYVDAELAKREPA